MEILLNKSTSKTSSNVNNFVPIELKGRNRVLPLETTFADVNEIELYNEERSNCNKIRLTCLINPICSNVLFNNVTEIIKNEGSDECEVLNYYTTPSTIINTNTLVSKRNTDFKEYDDAIRDTQLSNISNGFMYACGLNIFNNHILRSNTFKTVCKRPKTSPTNGDFNTIKDLMRTLDGEQIKGYSDVYEGTPNPDIDLHLYLGEDILSFKEAISQRLIDSNGWLGFTNIGKFGTYDDANKLYDIYKTINNKKSCDFIDMYPTRDLWSFTPKYNKYRHRIERNWDYCITYPSSSTTDVSFIRQTTNSLKITMFDETNLSANGTNGIIIYSISKHGLSVGNYVNLYSGNDVIIRNVEVSEIINDYTFVIYGGGLKISNKWKELSGDELKGKKFTSDGVEYTIYGNKNKYASVNATSIKYPILSTNRVNLDESKLDLSYKQVIDGNEVNYYVRIFSRLPNWKYSKIKPDEFELYKEGSDLIHQCQTIENEFESHMSKLAFSKTIYKDDVGEIVFTDDIEIDYLKDNLGRPLTDIFLTIVKTNQGYRKWYGINNAKPTMELEERGVNSCVVNTSDIEYSHCFGKLTCGFRLSKESLWDDSQINSLTINRLDNKNGLSLSTLNRIELQDIDNDEIQYRQIYDGDSMIYEGDTNFYGDLCCYSTTLLTEYVIQQVEFRFNTAQRELKASDESYSAFKNLVYDEITKDDYDDLKPSSSSENNNFAVTSYSISDVCQRKEGYVYSPHYKIPLRTFSDEIKQEKPLYVKIKDVGPNNQELLDEIYTLTKHFLNQYDKFYIRILDKKTKINQFIPCEVTEIINNRKFKFKPKISTNNDISRESIIDYGTLVIPSNTVPNYAKLSTEGSCYYMWRDVIQNGFDATYKIETYPFANGRLYVNSQINLFVKRQDPNGYGGMWSATYPFDADAKIISVINENNYFEEEDIKC